MTQSPRQSPSLQPAVKMMETVQRKLWLKQSLTPTEANFAAELSRQYHMKPTETVHQSESAVVVKRSNDIEPMFDAVKAMSDILSPNHSGAAGAKYVGSIDPITAANWAKEWGCSIGTKEFAKLASQRIKHDRDFHRFKFRG